MKYKRTSNSSQYLSLWAGIVVGLEKNGFTYADFLCAYTMPEFDWIMFWQEGGYDNFSVMKRKLFSDRFIRDKNKIKICEMKFVEYST